MNNRIINSILFSIFFLSMTGCATHVEKGWECFVQENFDCSREEWEQSEEPDLTKYADAADNIIHYYDELALAIDEDSRDGIFQNCKALLAEDKWEDKAWLLKAPVLQHHLIYAQKAIIYLFHERLVELKKQKQWDAFYNYYNEYNVYCTDSDNKHCVESHRLFNSVTTLRQELITKLENTELLCTDPDGITENLGQCISDCDNLEYNYPEKKEVVIALKEKAGSLYLDLIIEEINTGKKFEKEGGLDTALIHFNQAKQLRAQYLLSDQDQPTLAEIESSIKLIEAKIEELEKENKRAKKITQYKELFNKAKHTYENSVDLNSLRRAQKYFAKAKSYLKENEDISDAINEEGPELDPDYLLKTVNMAIKEKKKEIAFRQRELSKKNAKKDKELSIQKKKDEARRRYLAKGKPLTPPIAALGITSSGEEVLKGDEKEKWQGMANFPESQYLGMYSLEMTVPAECSLSYLKNVYNSSEDIFDPERKDLIKKSEKKYFTERYDGGKFFTQIHIDLEKFDIEEIEYTIKATVYKSVAD
jgi:hypothetical protein